MLLHNQSTTDSALPTNLLSTTSTDSVPQMIQHPDSVIKYPICLVQETKYYKINDSAPHIIMLSTHMIQHIEATC
jgi:hypothetical protein